MQPPSPARGRPLSRLPCRCVTGLPGLIGATRVTIASFQPEKCRIQRSPGVLSMRSWDKTGSREPLSALAFLKFSDSHRLTIQRRSTSGCAQFLSSPLFHFSRVSEIAVFAVVWHLWRYRREARGHGAFLCNWYGVAGIVPGMQLEAQRVVV